MSEKNLNKNIYELLKELGIPSDILGYNYLFMAIKKVYTESQKIPAMKLYKIIADAHQTTTSRVERSMRHAIEISMLRGNIEKINTVFAYTLDKEKCKPTPQEYIYSCVAYIEYGIT